jgi:hypothetical protein
MTEGYWHTNYFPTDFFHEDYWPDCGTDEGFARRSAKFMMMYGGIIWLNFL